MSFSSETKLEAASFQMKKPCCRRAFINGVLLGGADVSGEDISLYVEGAELAEICAKMIREQFGRETVPEKIGGRGILLLAFSSRSAGEFLQNCRIQADLSGQFKCEECIALFCAVHLSAAALSAPPTRRIIILR